MIILFHGDDLVSSRNALTQSLEKEREAEIIRFDGKKLSLSLLLPGIESHSLFSQKKVIVIENFLFGVVTKEKESMLASLQIAAKIHLILLWEDRKIEKATIKKYLSSAEEHSFVFPTLLFRFLDSFGTSSSSSLLQSFHALRKTQDAQLVFALLLRLVRQLILAKDMGRHAFGSTPSWQIEKYLKQATRWSLMDLIHIYRQLLSLDVKIKTGQTPYTLSELLDLFFLSL